MQSQDTVMAWARRLYSALLWLYPEEHRHTYGLLMTQLLLDQLRDARHQGVGHIIVLGLRTVLEVLATAPGEHLRGVIMDCSKPLLSWREALLMIVPGLSLLALWLPSLPTAVGRIATNIIVACIACAILIAAVAVWKRTRRIPMWGMPILSMVVTMLVWYLTIWPNVWVSGLFSRRGSLSDFEQSLLNFVTILAYALQWAIIILLFVIYARRCPLSRWAWATLGAYFVVMVGFSITTQAVATGLSIAVLNQRDSLLSALQGIFFHVSFLCLLLLPVALGLAIAHRQGLEALLFAVSGMTFVHQSLDIDYQLSFYSGNPSVVTLYNILWRFLAFVVAPLWMARARSNRTRLLAVMIPVLFASTLEVIVNSIVDPFVTATLVWNLGIVLVQPMLAMGVAYMFYRAGGVSRPQAADKMEIGPGVKTGRVPTI